MGELKALAEKFQNNGIKTVAISMGKGGAMIVRDKFVARCPALSVKAHSTVGAGDSFSAGFLVNYLSGKSMEECLSRATALSDFVVTQLGAVPEYPPELYKRIVPHV